jgi:hypothetical protein
VRQHQDRVLNTCYRFIPHREDAEDLAQLHTIAFDALAFLDARFACKGAYLYSRPLAMPAIPETDSLFAPPSAAGAPPPAPAGQLDAITGSALQ